MPPTRGISCLSMVLNGIRSGGTAEIRDSHKDTVKGGQIHSRHESHLSLCHVEPAKGKKCP